MDIQLLRIPNQEKMSLFIFRFSCFIKRYNFSTKIQKSIAKEPFLSASLLKLTHIQTQKIVIIK